MAGPGLSFLPTGDEADQKDASAQLSPTQRAIQIIGLRLPRVMGARRAIAPSQLLGASVGEGRMGGGLSPESALFRTLQTAALGDSPMFSTGLAASAGGSGGMGSAGGSSGAPSSTPTPNIIPGAGSVEAPTIFTQPMAPDPISPAIGGGDTREPMDREPRIPGMEVPERPNRPPRVPGAPAPMPPVEYSTPGRPPQTPRDPNEPIDIQGPQDPQSQIADMLGMGTDPKSAQTVAQALQEALASFDEDARRRRGGLA
jgi:hypothetical protein